MENLWREFINTLLTNSKCVNFYKEESTNSTTIEYYSYVNNPDSKIKVGYLDNGRLIILHYFNNSTPGYNKVDIEYFNENDFKENPEDYGDPGLLFNSTNCQAVADTLENGVNRRGDSMDKR